MKKKNIYTNQSQELLTLFEEAGNGVKVMCVPTPEMAFNALMTG